MQKIAHILSKANVSKKFKKRNQNQKKMWSLKFKHWVEEISLEEGLQQNIELLKVINLFLKSN